MGILDKAKHAFGGGTTDHSGDKIGEGIDEPESADKPTGGKHRADVEPDTEATTDATEGRHGSGTP